MYLLFWVLIRMSNLRIVFKSICTNIHLFFPISDISNHSCTHKTSYSLGIFVFILLLEAWMNGIEMTFLILIIIADLGNSIDWASTHRLKRLASILNSSIFYIHNSINLYKGWLISIRFKYVYSYSYCMIWINNMTKKWKFLLGF